MGVCDPLYNTMYVLVYVPLSKNPLHNTECSVRGLYMGTFK
jgi:hypothetical protein